MTDGIEGGLEKRNHFTQYLVFWLIDWLAFLDLSQFRDKVDVGDKQFVSCMREDLKTFWHCVRFDTCSMHACIWCMWLTWDKVLFPIWTCDIISPSATFIWNLDRKVKFVSSGFVQPLLSFVNCTHKTIFAKWLSPGDVLLIQWRGRLWLRWWYFRWQWWRGTYDEDEEDVEDCDEVT